VAGPANDARPPGDRERDRVRQPDRVPWRYLPNDFPPWRTVYGYSARWRDDGTLQLLHDG
jgi:transposase